MAASEGENSAAPYVRFFALAAFDAALAGGAWLPSLLLGRCFAVTCGDLSLWHSRELLFGFLGAVLAGFFLTALPRWTGQSVPRWQANAILILWLAARLAPLAPHPLAGIAALPGLALACVATLRVTAARDRRNAKTIALLWLYAGAGTAFAVASTAGSPELAMRLALAAALGLIMIVGGRVIPALTNRFDALRGAPPRPTHDAVQAFAAITAFLGLGGWLVGANGGALALALAGAALSQLLRLSVWWGRHTLASPPLRALYVAYAAIPAGFILLALHTLDPASFPESAALHMWMVGGIGGMALAIMSSMIRRRNGLAFVASPIGRASMLSCFIAAALRSLAPLAAEPANLLVAAACAWVAAFCFFIVDFRCVLLGRRWRIF